LSANLDPRTGFLPLGISGGPVKLGAVIGCAPVLTVSSSYTHWGISPTSVNQGVESGPGATVWKTQFENQRSITIDANLLSELSGKYLVCKIVHDDARFTGINLQPKGLASLFVSPSQPEDTSPPVGSSWNSGFFGYAGGTYTPSFKAIDNVGVSRTQFVLVKNGADVLTQAGAAIPGLSDFYSGAMTLPSDGTGKYEIRFEAYDAAGNKYSWTSTGGALTIVNTPVYLGGASYSTTSDPSGRVKVGDTFSCNSGSWAQLGTKYRVVCLWTNWTTGAQFEGPVFTVDQPLVDATSNKTISFTLRLRDAVSGAVVGGYTQEPGGLSPFIMDQLKAWSLDGPR
jgi:hypothetical protein